MAANALEEKINKIRQQNEEIRRRHEEVEEDKKNAAKLNALVQMVPSTDWPERKEPPEFSNPPRASNKPKPAKEHHEPPQQYQAAGGEGRKVHTFAQGQGPPPDPKYNFLADSEREESNMESIKDTPPNRGQKYSRGTFRKKLGGKDGMQRDYRTNRGPHRDEHQPEYEAWRAERNRIDEDRISRQRTAEGNWRREWDNDKAHIVNEATRSEAKLGDYVKRDHKDYDRRYHVNGNEYAHHNRGGNRSYRGNSKHFHSNYENRSNNTYYQDGHAKNPLSPGSEGRTVIATDKGIKVTLNQGNMKGPVTSVKVNSPSIAGTGRVGPRQRSRVTYSSHSDVEVTSGETDSFSRPKSFEDKTKGIYHDNLQRSPSARKTQPLQKKKDLGNKSPYFRKKEIGREDTNAENAQKQHETELRPVHALEEHKVSQESESKLEKLEENNAVPPQDDHAIAEQGSTVTASGEPDAKIDELNTCDNQSNDSSTQMNVSEIHAETESQSISTNLELTPASQVQTEIEVSEVIDTVESESNETKIVQATASVECKAAETDLTTVVKDTDDNDKNETKLTADTPCDLNNDTEKIHMEKSEEQNSPTEQTEEIHMEKSEEQNPPTEQTEEIHMERGEEQNPPTEQTEEIHTEKSEEQNPPTEQTEEIHTEKSEEQNPPTEQTEEIHTEKSEEQNPPTEQTEEIHTEKSEEQNSPTEQTEEIHMEKSEEQNSPTEQTKEIVSDNCDSERSENTNERENKQKDELENDIEHDTKDSTKEKKEADNVTSSCSTDACSVMKENNQSENDDKALKNEEVLADVGVAAADEKINSDNKQDTLMTCTNETRERTVVNDDEEKKNDATNDAAADKAKSTEDDLQAEKEKAVSNETIETEKTIE